MRGPIHSPNRRRLGLAATIALAAAVSPSAVAGTAPGAADLPDCDELSAVPPDDGRVVRPWSAELDADGVVTGYRLGLRARGVELELRSGPSAFGTEVAVDRALVGERAQGRTRVHMLDTRRACRLWSRSLEGSLFLERAGSRNGWLHLSVVDPATRAYRGRLLLDAESGTAGELKEVECMEACLPTDGAVSLTALAPAGEAQPVPSFSAGGWERGKRLTYRWRAGGVPPRWARPPLKDAAADATGTSRARSPRYVFDTDAANAIAYSGSVPGYCGINGIACAGRAMPSTWGVWIRPHGTEYAWGVLRWCQKTSSSSGCFDIRRVLLHELGHVDGLDHPSNAGFTLAPTETVMHAITPIRPSPGASRHSFGRCDVATLQELYDTPTTQTRISTCNDVGTRLALESSTSAVTRGGSVTLKARLRVASKSAFGHLAGDDLDDRSVKLKYRRAGSNDPWTTAWMRPKSRYGRYVLSISPAASWEFKAVFPAPTNEGLRYSRSALVKVKVAG